MELPGRQLTAELEMVSVYTSHAGREVERVRRNLSGLSADDMAELLRKPEEQVQKMETSVATNVSFLERITARMRKHAESGPADGASGDKSDAQVVTSKTAQELLNAFMHEWSREGGSERSEGLRRLLGALDANLQGELEAARSGGKAVRVLCPSAQLGRLPFELLQKGCVVEACEANRIMYFANEFVRCECAVAEEHCIQPYGLNTCNRVKMDDHVRRLPIPDVAVPEGLIPQTRFGNFIQLYDTASSRASFDAVVTAFALDTSSNVFRYVRTVAHCVRPGGVWANFGPLAYDTEHDEAHGQSVELSWEELRFAVSYFFEIKDEGFVDTFHRGNPESMMQCQYECVFFSAVRNDKPASGIGGTA